MSAMRAPHRFCQALDVLCLIPWSKVVELDARVESQLDQEVRDLVFGGERVLPRHRAHIQIKVTDLRGQNGTIGVAAADSPHLYLRDDRAARRLVHVLLLILRSPGFDCRDGRGSGDEHAGARGKRRAVRQIRCVERRLIRGEGDLVPELSRFHPHEAETGAFGHKGVVGDAAVGDEEARAEFLRFPHGAWNIIAGLTTGFCDDGADQKIASETEP